MTSDNAEPSRYSQILEFIFKKHHKTGLTELDFNRREIDEAADSLGIDRVKNLGDLIYSFRFRNPLPAAIRDTAPDGQEWIIEAAGRSKYKLLCATTNRIVPQQHLVKIKIPECTPEIVTRYALGDEQALLAKVRYNRLVDIFLGITSYSLQNHLRTTVKGMGQIEIDELYVGVDRTGSHFVVPVQAKGGKDQIGGVQSKQDIAFCIQRYPDLVCRAVATQFMAEKVIAMFELTIEDGLVKVVRERHYKLVRSSELTADDLRQYKMQVD